MNYQTSQIPFTGKIDSMYRLGKNNQRTPLTANETKTLRPVINYLKHNCAGNHNILIQDSPVAITVNSKYSPGNLFDRSGHLISTSLVGYNVDKSSTKQLLADVTEFTETFKNIRKREKLRTWQKRVAERQQPQEPTLLNKIASSIKGLFTNKSKQL